MHLSDGITAGNVQHMTVAYHTPHVPTCPKKKLICSQPPSLAILHPTSGGWHGLTPTLFPEMNYSWLTSFLFLLFPHSFLCAYCSPFFPPDVFSVPSLHSHTKANCIAGLCFSKFKLYFSIQQMMKTAVTAPTQDICFLIETHMKPDICYKFSWIVTNTGNISH